MRVKSIRENCRCDSEMYEKIEAQQLWQFRAISSKNRERKNEDI